MKNAIMYYYGLSSYDIRKVGKRYYFKSGTFNYALVSTILPHDVIENQNELNNKLISSGVFSNQLIYNNENSLITRINNLDYVLIKYFTSLDKITLNDIIVFSNISISKEKTLNWKNLWSDKIDYMEYQITQFGKKHPLIRESFSYYVGLAENAISLLNYIGNNFYLNVSHKRIHYNDTLFDLYNPLNYVIDSRVRDICEYIKNKFFYSNDSRSSFFSLIEVFISNQKFTNDEYILFFSRLMFPSYYFDLYEDIMVDSSSDDKLNIIINKVNEFESILKQTYKYINKFVQMPDIEWLKNN